MKKEISAKATLLLPVTIMGIFWILLGVGMTLFFLHGSKTFSLLASLGGLSIILSFIIGLKLLKKEKTDERFEINATKALASTQKYSFWGLAIISCAFMILDEAKTQIEELSFTEAAIIIPLFLLGFQYLWFCVALKRLEDI